MKNKKIYLTLKEYTDRALGCSGLVLLSPLFLGVAVAIKLEDGIFAPTLFSQKRVGQGKEHFQLYKFRSMKLDTPHDKPTHELENPEQYITRVGKFLRKSSLDELPQLYNIARGDMALIGPRPALWNQYDLIEERDRYGANDVKPGLSGWAQINGRDELEIPVKAKLDGFYVKHQGLLMDLACLFGTVFAVLGEKGVVEGGTGELKRQNADADFDWADPKKKLLIVTNHSYMLWQFRRELIAKLQEGYDVTISTPFVGHEEDFAEMGCHMVEATMERRGMNPLQERDLIRSYRKLLKDVKPDKVITYSIKPNLYMGMLCRLKKIPYYVNVQGLGTAFQSKKMAAVASIMYREACRKARAVFFENKGNAAVFVDRKIIPAEKEVILNGAGVNTEYFEYQPMQEHEDGKLHFLYLGRIMKEKGIDELFAAMRKLHSEYGDKAVLDLVGFYEDEYEQEVNKLVKEGIAVFHGFQTDPRPWYAMADCVVLPSYHEGMSNVLLEAASTGRMLVTSDIPGCREAVDEGVNGFLCTSKDTTSLYQAMTKVMEMTNEERTQAGLCGRGKMEREFKRSDVIERITEVLE